MKHALNTMQIRHLHLIEMPGLRPQFRRPIDVVGTPAELGDLIDAIKKAPEDANAELVTASKVAPHINSFLRYSGHAKPAFEPPNGWAAPRYSFILEVDVKPIAFSGKQTLIVLGYTDDIPEGSQHLPAEEMLDQVTFNINSILTSRSFIGQAETGEQPYHQMVANQHLYNDPTHAGLNHAEWMEALRPCDIFSRIAMNLRLPDMDMASVIDTRTVLTHMPRTSDRLNVNPAFLLSKVLNGYLNAKANTYSDIDQQGLVEEARGYVEESPAGLNPLLRELVGEREMGPSKSFKMSDLQRLDVTVKDRTIVVVGNQPAKDLIDGGFYTSMDEESLESHIAYSLGVTVPALLGKVGITHAKFTLACYASNGNQMESGLQFNMIDLTGVGSIHDVRAKEEFFLDLLSVVIPQITGNYTIPVFLEVDSNLNGLTLITVRMKLDGSKKQFVVPSFMDTLISPVLARKTEGWSELEHVASGIGALLDEVALSIDAA